ncbi:hypothetical protein ASPVEDRAFT_43546 [Aspergillus versicolor CBS 583.65]|uniref:Uncharacterized protein n=1 Tax=Aspergillus versicolor CBS 583.65 TaxID=1036611 RepID=A0A1L9PRD9_ASPVE|nr:uncharacterized protein ASPVEDRAFT_43546 [Aspergillus versicolor CBS 583.65]OJJ04090.1 hypothetical protein ASPVEDRAFT_43546 [Aspergillus versicolor CBS 583.65]
MLMARITLFAFFSLISWLCRYRHCPQNHHRTFATCFMLLTKSSMIVFFSGAMYPESLHRRSEGDSSDSVVCPSIRGLERHADQVLGALHFS